MMEAVLVGFGGRLKAWRKVRGISQGGLAIKVGRSQGLCSEFEHGHRKPTSTFLKAIAKAFGYSELAHLIYDDETRADDAERLIYELLPSTKTKEIITQSEVENRLMKAGWERRNGHLVKQVGVTMQRIKICETTISRWYRCSFHRDWQWLFQCPLSGVSEEGKFMKTRRY